MSNIDRLAGQGPSPAPTNGAIPTELLLRRDRSIRYERGGVVYATDGRLGVLRQVVLDQAGADVVALIVEMHATGRRALLSPDLVDKTAGSAVFLLVTQHQAAELADRAPEYRKDRYRKVDVKALAKKLKGRAAGPADRPRWTVAEAGRDFVATPVVSLLERAEPVAATRPEPLAASRPAPVAPALRTASMVRVEPGRVAPIESAV